MKYLPLLNGPKWDLLMHISMKPCSPKELSEKTKTSLTNVLQQLSILEAYDLVARKKEKSKGPGKPRTKYYLKKEFIHTTHITRENVGKRFLNLKKQDMYQSIMLNQIQAGLFDSGNEAYYLTKFFYKNEDLIRDCEAIGYFQTESESLELLVITSKNLQAIRDSISNQIIHGPGKEQMKLVLWSHSKDEFSQGIQRKEKHYMNFKGRIIPLFDPDKFFASVKEKD